MTETLGEHERSRICPATMADRPVRPWLRLLFGTALLCISAFPSNALSIASRFVGPTPTWSEPSSWSPLLTSFPDNDPVADLQFDVRIAAPECPASSVILDATAPSVEIDSLTLDSDCRLDILAGSELRVREQAFLGGELFVDGGQVVVADRSVVPFAAAGVGSMSWVVRNGGTLDLGGADKVVAAGLAVDVTDASVVFANLTSMTPVVIEVHETPAGLPASVSLDGVAQILGTSQLRLSTGELKLSGALVHDQTDPTALNLSSATVTVTGITHLEIAGLDVGTDCAALPDSNFGIAQLVVGTPTSAGDLWLADFQDNGRHGGPEGNLEALYLLGPGTGDPCARTGGDGLVIGPGSLIRLQSPLAGGRLPVYVYQQSSGTFVDLTSLLPPTGEGCIEAFGGEVCTGLMVFSDSDADGVPDQYDDCATRRDGLYDAMPQLDADQDGYGDACDVDYDQSGTTNVVDFAVFLSEFGGPSTVTDHTGNGFTSVADFSLFLASFARGIPPGPTLLSCADPTIRVADGDAPCVAGWP